ncbi:MAG: hypothetical protein AB1439_07080 [candidate division FCPU426 bacterium]
MNLQLEAEVEPAVWPANKMRDITIRLRMTNNSPLPVTIYPAYTALAWKVSVASMGMTWDLKFKPEEPGLSASGHELRTYYGPPGEPVSELAVRKAGKVLKPGAEHVTTLQACWIPHALLQTEHLSMQTLDPEGLDNLRSIPQFDKCSVLVFGASSAWIKDHSKSKEMLRGFMVVFFSGPGRYTLRASYHQTPVMCKIVEELKAEATGVEVEAGK